MQQIFIFCIWHRLLVRQVAEGGLFERVIQRCRLLQILASIWKMQHSHSQWATGKSCEIMQGVLKNQGMEAAWLISGYTALTLTNYMTSAKLQRMLGNGEEHVDIWCAWQSLSQWHLFISHLENKINPASREITPINAIFKILVFGLPSVLIPRSIQYSWDHCDL